MFRIVKTSGKFVAIGVIPGIQQNQAFPDLSYKKFGARRGGKDILMGSVTKGEQEIRAFFDEL